MFITNRAITTGSTEAGFSLVEVLVAMLILAIGLLGLAALQTQGVRFNNDAFIRTQGTTIAYDIIDKLRVNRTNAINYTTANFPARNALPGSGFYTWATPPYNCNPLLASITNDLACWLNTVELVLPLGQATITQQVAPNDDLFNISISWLDRQFKTDATCNAQTNHTWTAANNCLVNQTWTVWP
jgi:type IV pilus assembly protein PilV